MSQKIDELADAILLDWDAGLDDPGRERFRNELRTLAGDATKQALLDAAEAFHNENSQVDGVANWLVDRAGQIGD